MVHHGVTQSGQIRCVTIAGDAARQRLDKALAQSDLGLTRQRLQALITDGAVRVNGQVVTSRTAQVGPGDVIAVAVPPPQPARLEAEDIPLVILYEDEDILVIDKPAGLVVHPAPGNRSGTLVNALLAHCGASLAGIGGVQRPGIVHRLDKDTSGVMVVAKSDRASQSLTGQFAAHSIDRVYRAVVWGRPTPLVGTIEGAIGRHRTARTKMAVTAPDQGRAARTHYKVERSFGRPEKPVASLVSCRLETGRTHQVRVHMASIGHPLIGDALYGGRRKMEMASGAPFGRHALHAAVLGLEHPETGERLTFESQLPSDIVQLILHLETI